VSVPSVSVLIETGKKFVFASALDWPGWARRGRTEADAVATLVDYGPRFAIIARAAGLRLPATITAEVVERVAGNATTDFGAPGALGANDHLPLTPTEATQFESLFNAAWRSLDDAAAGAPAVLRTGPRGGGRQRDAIYQHVVDAQHAYSGKLGIRLGPPVGVDGALTERRALGDAIGAGATATTAPGRWPMRYGARRMIWHVVDHLWEIEDRSP
jgi:hypothetical protein